VNKQQILWTLAVANVALAATLAWRGIAPNTANAQRGGQGVNTAPQSGKYTMIPGSSQIGVSIIYVLDTVNNRIGAIAPNARETLDTMPTLALKPIFDAAAAGAGGPSINPDNPRPQPVTPVNPRRP
jgi:hypothetical protein